MGHKAYESEKKCRSKPHTRERSKTENLKGVPENLTKNKTPWISLWMKMRASAMQDGKMEIQNLGAFLWAVRW
jgi:hypothetical protein